MVDEQTQTPKELTLDQNTGVFSLANQAEIKTTYEVAVDIATSDGVNTQTLTVERLAIIKKCGAGSTTLVPPELEQLRQAPNLAPLITTGGKFETTNPVCPIT